MVVIPARQRAATRQQCLQAVGSHCAPFPPLAAGSPDLIAARKVADFLGTIHTEFTFTVGGPGGICSGTVMGVGRQAS